MGGLSRKESTLFTVTEEAAVQLKGIMEQQELSDIGVRVFVRHQCGCGAVNYGMGFDDSSNDEDEVYEHAGVKFLVDRGALGTLEGATIDFVETEMSKGFSISNPNSSGCGCGGGH